MCHASSCLWRAPPIYTTTILWGLAFSIWCSDCKLLWPSYQPASVQNWASPADLAIESCFTAATIHHIAASGTCQVSQVKAETHWYDEIHPGFCTKIQCPKEDWRNKNTSFSWWNQPRIANQIPSDMLESTWKKNKAQMISQNIRWHVGTRWMTSQIVQVLQMDPTNICFAKHRPFWPLRVQ